MRQEGDHLQELKQPAADDLIASAQACFANASALLEDARLLVAKQRFATGYAVAILAQEEFAKSFILCTCASQPRWDIEVWKALHRHGPKQALVEVMDYYVNWFVNHNSFALRLNANALIPAPVTHMPEPAQLASWLSKVRGSVIDKGSVDRSKQDALYVAIGKNGKVSSAPSCTKEHATSQLQKATTFQQLAGKQLNDMGRHAVSVGA